MSAPLIETENPNDTAGRNPGDPTVSLDADGTVANEASLIEVTAPVNATSTPTSDPCHVESPYQPAAESAPQREAAKIREEALQAENRFRPETPGGPSSPGRRPPLHEVPDQPHLKHEAKRDEPKHENKHKRD